MLFLHGKYKELVMIYEDFSGFQLNNLIAFAISGLRCIGSSIGSFL